MRRFAMLLACLGASACASTPVRTEYVFTERAVLPLDQAEGLTSAQLEERLGFTPSARRIITSATLEDGVVVEYARGLSGVMACPKDGWSTVRLREGEATPTTLSDPFMTQDWVFHDGRYVWPGPPERRPGTDGRPPAYFVSGCVEPRRSGSAARPIDYLALPLALPYLAVVGTAQQLEPDVTRGELTERDVNRALGVLSLGAPPPGGLEAWMANLPPHVTLISQEAGVVTVSVNRTMPNAKAHPDTVRIYRENAQMRGDVVVTFEKGVATKFEIPPNNPANRHVCTLTPARSFQCVERPAGRKPFIDLTMTR